MRRCSLTKPAALLLLLACLIASHYVVVAVNTQTQASSIRERTHTQRQQDVRADPCAGISNQQACDASPDCTW
jgi:hypothetical protein